MASRYFSPTKQETEEVANDPYVQELVKRVRAFAYTHCMAKNLYAWREFIFDLQTDIQLFIYDYEIAYKKGLYRKTGFPAYCNAVKQQALNWVAYYSAHKRKVNNETISIEASEEDESTPTIQLVSRGMELQQIDTLCSIQQQFGNTIKDLCVRLLGGEALNKEDLNKLRKVSGLGNFLRN